MPHLWQTLCRGCNLKYSLQVLLWTGVPENPRHSEITPHPTYSCSAKATHPLPSLRILRPNLRLCKTIPIPVASFLLQDLGFNWNSCPHSVQFPKRSIFLFKIFYLLRLQIYVGHHLVSFMRLCGGRRPERRAHLTYIKQLFGLDIVWWTM